MISCFFHFNTHGLSLVAVFTCQEHQTEPHEDLLLVLPAQTHHEFATCCIFCKPCGREGGAGAGGREGAFATSLFSFPLAHSEVMFLTVRDEGLASASHTQPHLVMCRCKRSCTVLNVSLYLCLTYVVQPESCFCSFFFFAPAWMNGIPVFSPVTFILAQQCRHLVISLLTTYYSLYTISWITSMWYKFYTALLLPV